jgi:S1-C subfamily serine protease
MVTSGIISKPLHTTEYEEGGKILGSIVTDTPIVGGNSGGPIIKYDWSSDWNDDY